MSEHALRCQLHNFNKLRELNLNLTIEQLQLCRTLQMTLHNCCCWHLLGSLEQHAVFAKVFLVKPHRRRDVAVQPVDHYVIEKLVQREVLAQHTVAHLPISTSAQNLYAPLYLHIMISLLLFIRRTKTRR